MEEVSLPGNSQGVDWVQPEINQSVQLHEMGLKLSSSFWNRDVLIFWSNYYMAEIIIHPPPKVCHCPFFKTQCTSVLFSENWIFVFICNNEIKIFDTHIAIKFGYIIAIINGIYDSYKYQKIASKYGKMGIKLTVLISLLQIDIDIQFSLMGNKRNEINHPPGFRLCTFMNYYMIN